MRILIATPLYPPDIGAAAPYVKELARRLAHSSEVTVLTYGRYPEAVEGVRILAVDKRRPLLVRLLSFTLRLLREMRTADVVLAENGPSVELPLLLASYLSRTPLVLHVGDEEALRRLHGSARSISRAVRGRVHAVVDERPLPRPEIHPLLAAPSLEEYEASWHRHISVLQGAFLYGN